jgi:hypothetical protein
MKNVFFWWGRNHRSQIHMLNSSWPCLSIDIHEFLGPGLDRLRRSHICPRVDTSKISHLYTAFIMNCSAENPCSHLELQVSGTDGHRSLHNGQYPNTTKAMTAMEGWITISQPFTEQSSRLWKLRTPRRRELSSPILNFDMPRSQAIMHLIEGIKSRSGQKERLP